jgi:hypothetical protein
VLEEAGRLSFWMVIRGMNFFDCNRRIALRIGIPAAFFPHPDQPLDDNQTNGDKYSDGRSQDTSQLQPNNDAGINTHPTSLADHYRRLNWRITGETNIQEDNHWQSGTGHGYGYKKEEQPARSQGWQSCIYQVCQSTPSNQSQKNGEWEERSKWRQPANVRFRIHIHFDYIPNWIDIICSCEKAPVILCINQIRCKRSIPKAGWGNRLQSDCLEDCRDLRKDQRISLVLNKG